VSDILLVDDNAAMRDTLRAWLAASGHQILEAADGQQALDLLERSHVDAVVTDLRMPGLDGLQLLQRVRENEGGPLMIMMTAHGGVEEAVAAMRAGAEDFLVKPFPLEELELKLQRALGRRLAAGRQRSLEAEARPRELLGRSPVLLKALQAIEKAAASRSTVLLTGESGTGKELAARALHQGSPQKDGPFVSVHCASLAPGVLESELFGHEKGAFTGAVARRAGRFELAQGGTLFLDEVSEIPPETQVKLLRVLQEREFERVGGTKTLKADFRLVAASNRDLQQMVAQGRFREDLYYRLGVVRIQLPALRERPEDLPLLAEYFGRRACAEQAKAWPGLDPDCLHGLRAHRWSGNVRELQNLMEQAVVFNEGGPLFPLPMGTGAIPAGGAVLEPGGLDATMDKLESELITQALKGVQGVQAQAAQRLGLSRSALQYKVRKHGLEKHCRGGEDA
jgi:DNA-binding NtrC family response regulator